MNGMNVNQIVKGKVAGTFVILGFRMVGSVPSAQLKAVNPNNHSETAPGELCLPLTALAPIA